MAGSLLSILPDTEYKGGSVTSYLLVLTGVLSAAFYVVISSRLVGSFDPVSLLTGQLLFSLILSSVFLLITGTPVSIPSETTLLVIVSGILQYFLAFYLYLHALRWIQVHIAGVMLYFIPVIALILSWIYLGEDISVIQCAGIAVTISSVYLLNRKYENEH